MCIVTVSDAKEIAGGAPHVTEPKNQQITGRKEAIVPARQLLWILMMTYCHLLVYEVNINATKVNYA